MARFPSRGGSITSLTALRIIYGVLLLGQVSYLIVVLFGLLPREGSQREMRSIFALIDWALFVSTVPITFSIRAVIFGATRGPNGIPIDTYAAGNLVFWAGCEAVTLVSLTFVYLTATMKPWGFIAAIDFLLQLATFPRASSVSVRQRPL